MSEPALTRTQERIFEVIYARDGDWIGGRELRDAVIPGRLIKNVHVQVHRMIGKGVPIEGDASHKGRQRRGYRLKVA